MADEPRPKLEKDKYFENCWIARPPEGYALIVDPGFEGVNQAARIAIVKVRDENL